MKYFSVCCALPTQRNINKSTQRLSTQSPWLGCLYLRLADRTVTVALCVCLARPAVCRPEHHRRADVTRHTAGERCQATPQLPFHDSGLRMGTVDGVAMEMPLVVTVVCLTLFRLPQRRKSTAGQTASPRKRRQEPQAGLERRNPARKARPREHFGVEEKPESPRGGGNGPRTVDIRRLVEVVCVPPTVPHVKNITLISPGSLEKCGVCVLNDQGEEENRQEKYTLNFFDRPGCC